MASVTDTSVVQITLTDSQGKNRTINLDDPISDSSLTLNRIREVFQIPISNGWLYDRTGEYQIVSVKQAVVSNATKYPLSNGTATVAPSTLNIATPQAVGGTAQGTVTVSGGVLTAAYLSNIVATGAVGQVSFTDNEITVTLAATGSSGNSYQANLVLVVSGTTINVPINNS